MALDGKIDLHDVVLVPIKSLKKDPGNPNVMNERQMNGLRASMKRFGYLQPVIVDKNTMVIADGEHRATIYEESGRTEVPCILLDLKDDAERRLLRQTMNKLRGEHSPEKDSSEIEFLVKASRLGELTLLTGIDSQKLLSIIKGEHFEEESNKAPEEPSSKIGQIWALGRHRLMCGDSTKIKDVQKLVGKNWKNISIQTDPPYHIGWDYSSHDDVSDVKYEELRSNLMSYVSRAKNAIVFCGPNNISSWIAKYPPFSIGFWLKRNSRSGSKLFRMSRVEPMLFYGDFGDLKRSNDLFEYLTPQGELKPLEGDIPDERRVPLKPRKLMIDTVSTFAKESDLIFDPFSGEGTTLIACEQANRTALAMEISPVYCDIIIARWEKLTGRKAELVH